MVNTDIIHDIVEESHQVFMEKCHEDRYIS